MAAMQMDEAVLGIVRDSMSPADFALLLNMFRDDLAHRVADLRRGQADLDRDLIGRTAHQIVGTAGNMGATHLAAAAQDILLAAATAPADRLRQDISTLILLIGETQAATDALALPRG
jgi:HPt (histidine-containing phosphotransfer) domain-containing protein